MTESQNGIIHFELPSGGWWDLRVPYFVKDMVPYRAALLALPEGSNALASHVGIVAFTADWSFGKPIALDTLGDVPLQDEPVMLEAYATHIAPLLRQRDAALRKASLSL